jgi:hypothetical protein
VVSVPGSQNGCGVADKTASGPVDRIQGARLEGQHFNLPLVVP